MHPSDIENDEEEAYKLTHLKCYMCVPIQYRMTETQAHPWPRRKIKKSYTPRGPRISDPTTVYELECGHTII